MLRFRSRTRGACAVPGLREERGGVFTGHGLPWRRHQITVTGSVRDSTLALVPGAVLTLDADASVKSGSDGRFRFSCVASGPHKLAVKAEGFAPVEMDLKLPHTGDVQFVLKPGHGADRGGGECG